MPLLAPHASELPGHHPDTTRRPASIAVSFRGAGYPSVRPRPGSRGGEDGGGQSHRRQGREAAVRLQGVELAGGFAWAIEGAQLLDPYQATTQSVGQCLPTVRAPSPPSRLPSTPAAHGAPLSSRASSPPSRRWQLALPPPPTPPHHVRDRLATSREGEFSVARDADMAH